MSDERFSREEAKDMWEQGKPTQLERPSRAMTSLLSVRLARDVLRKLTMVARGHGKGPATFARELIEQGLALDDTELRAISLRVLARFLEKIPESQEVLAGTLVHEFRSISWSRDLLHFAAVGGPPIERQWRRSYWGRPFVISELTGTSQSLGNP